MITVIAGVNGAGKSSILGENVRFYGGEYFNPDEVAQSILKDNPEYGIEHANSEAWALNFEQLKRAIANNEDYTFETTLGGNSITEALLNGMENGVLVRVLFCGLSSADLHIERVAARVARGGHAIPEEKIRERWSNSIHNMMLLVAKCHAVRVFDNSAPLNEGKAAPVTLFAMQDDGFTVAPLEVMPSWAKPLASSAIKRAC
jgi:predicted ABC-type ATPase